MKHLKHQKLTNKEIKGVVELYKNNKRIRNFNFGSKEQRINYMKRILEYSDVHLNNYFFIIKLNNDELF